MISAGKHKILVVDDEETVRTILAKFLYNEGFEPIEATQGEQAIELYRMIKPTLVVSDIMMPKMDGLTLLQKLRSIDANAIVILMTGYGSEDILLKALRGGAINYFKKPFIFQEMIDFIRHVLEHRREIDTSQFFSSHLVEESKTFVFNTGAADILPIINQVTTHLKNIVAEHEIVNLKVGIEEMIINAIEHGNLGITFAMKNDAIKKGKWGNLLQSRLEEGENHEKKIFVESELKPSSFLIKIRDEGEGFDWQSLPQLTAEALLSYNGRGIFLTKIYYDDVLYSQTGNEVTLIKYNKKE